MSNKLKKTFQVIFGLILLGGLSWLVILGVIQLGSWYRGLDNSLQTGIVAAVPVVAVAFIGYFANKSLETKRSVEQAMRPRKLELYDEFITFLMRLFANEKVVERPDEMEMMHFFADQTPNLITFASNPVIEKWGKLRVGLSDEVPDVERMFLLEEMIKEIRVDLGHSKRGFHKGDILRLFINDIDDYLKK